MNVVDAVSVGREIWACILAQKHVQGTVVGAFSHGVYFRVGNSIFLVHDEKDGRVPFGIEISDFLSVFSPCKNFLNCTAYLSPEKLCFEDKDLAVGIKSVYDGVETVCAGLDVETLRRRSQSILSFLRGSHRGWLASVLYGGETGDQGQYRIRTIAAEGIALLLKSLTSRAEEDIRYALNGIIGLGVGLTPSMDDWLVGFTYALRRIPSCGAESDVLCRSLMRVCREGGTGMISKTYILSAAKGGYFELLDKCLYEGSPKSFEVLSGIGGSSGCDMLTGMLAAVEYSLDSFLRKRGRESKSEKDI